MPQDWNNLEGVQATERIVRAAVSNGASEVHISSDTDGATVLFMSAHNMEFFAQLPAECKDRVLAYLRVLGSIDAWESTPVSGVGTFAGEDHECQLEIRLLKSDHGENAVIRISK